MGLVLERHVDAAMATGKKPGDGFSGREIADIAGATYRQIDYWSRIGLLKESIAGARGSGSRRRYSEADIEIASALVDIVRLRLDTAVIFPAVNELRRRRVDPAGEWMLVPLRGGHPVRTLHLDATVPTPSILLRLRSFSPAGDPSDSTAGDPAGDRTQRGAA